MNWDDLDDNAKTEFLDMVDNGVNKDTAKEAIQYKYGNRLAAGKDAPSALESGLRGAAQGLSFGFADELEAGAKSLFGDRSYESEKALARLKYAQAEEANPGAYGVGDVGGQVGSMFMPMGWVGKAGKAVGAAVKGTKRGAQAAEAVGAATQAAKASKAGKFIEKAGQKAAEVGAKEVRLPTGLGKGAEGLKGGGRMRGVPAPARGNMGEIPIPPDKLAGAPLRPPTPEELAIAERLGMDPHKVGGFAKMAKMDDAAREAAEAAQRQAAKTPAPGRRGAAPEAPAPAPEPMQGVEFRGQVDMSPAAQAERQRAQDIMARMEAAASRQDAAMAQKRAARAAAEPPPPPPRTTEPYMQPGQRVTQEMDAADFVGADLPIPDALRAGPRARRAPADVTRAETAQIPMERGMADARGAFAPTGQMPAVASAPAQSLPATAAAGVAGSPRASWMRKAMDVTDVGVASGAARSGLAGLGRSEEGGVNALQDAGEAITAGLAARGGGRLVSALGGRLSGAARSVPGILSSKGGDVAANLGLPRAVGAVGGQAVGSVLAKRPEQIGRIAQVGGEVAGRLGYAASPAAATFGGNRDEIDALIEEAQRLNSSSGGAAPPPAASVPDPTVSAVFTGQAPQAPQTGADAFGEDERDVLRDLYPPMSDDDWQRVKATALATY